MCRLWYGAWLDPPCIAQHIKSCITMLCCTISSWWLRLIIYYYILYVWDFIQWTSHPHQAYLEACHCTGSGHDPQEEDRDCPESAGTSACAFPYWPAWWHQTHHQTHLQHAHQQWWRQHHVKILGQIIMIISTSEHDPKAMRSLGGGKSCYW